MESNINKWSIGQKVSLSWKTKQLKKNKKNSYERMIGSNYICIREASDGHNGILLRVLDNAKASSVMLISGQPFFMDESARLFEGFIYSSYSTPSLAELKEILAILGSNSSLLVRFDEASMPINLKSLFWVNETARNTFFQKKPLCYNPSTDSLCIASDPVAPCRLTLVYFNSQQQLIDFVTDLSDAAAAAGKLIQQTSDVAWKKWVLPAVVSLAVVFYGGYLTGKYSNDQKDVQPDPVDEALVSDKAPAEENVPEKKEPAKEKVAKEKVAEKKEPEKKDPTKEKVAEEKVAEKKEPEKKEPAKEKVAEKKDSVVLDQYEAKDNRVRTGGYRIIGTDRVMTIKEGDNLTRIAKRTLGPGMECYIEVYNDISSKTELKAGQTIKIPKLERKKKKK